MSDAIPADAILLITVLCVQHTQYTTEAIDMVAVAYLYIHLQKQGNRRLDSQLKETGGKQKLLFQISVVVYFVLQRLVAIWLVLPKVNMQIR